ncbi:MAG: S8 family serine peptidase, partial [bacterium]
MKRILLFLLISLFASAAYKEGEVLVKVRDKKAISSLGVSILSQEHLFDKTYKLSVSGDIFEVISSLKKNPDVVYAEPNYIRHICVSPNDPDFSKQWGLNKVSAPSAWDISTGTDNVIIAIVDTGVDYTHPDLAGKVIKGRDFVNNDNDPMDDNDHGTHVTGIAAAETNNGTGIAGLAWNCKLLAVKCLDDKGFGNDADIDKAIRYAADNGAKVINMSFGGEEAGITIKEACDYAYNKGVFLVAATGNDGNATMFYPAGYENVMAVAATNQNDQKAGFSNYGGWVDVASPGMDIYSTIPNSKYAYLDGTSMASPFVAGLGGLLFSKYPLFTNGSVAYTIKYSGDDLGIPGIGRRVNCDKAIRLEVATETETSTKTWTFMVYLDADNDLESAAIDDFLEMSSIGSNDDINIVVQMDRINGYNSSYGNWTGTKRFYITKNMTPIPENAYSDIGEANMGDPDTLKNFINWAKSSYPAENYALVLWDHGSGWKTKALERRKPKAVCYDDT